jgi:MinD superfamily P-loop ATPase
MRIAVASGKGGTGKTLVSTSLTRLWSSRGLAVTYVDADAEEPNGHLFLNPKIESRTRFAVKVPVLKGKSCAGHAKCQEICAFNAILSAKGSIIVFDELCHGCGACLLACPDGSLIERDREIGTVFAGRTGEAGFISGSLDVGEARVTPLIEGTVHRAGNAGGIVVVDSPPGTSCSAIAAVEGSDLLLLVTEPTPFGMHDLELAVEMGRTLGLSLAAAINRADLGDNRVRKYLDAEGIPTLAEIPFDRSVAEAYAAGRSCVDECDAFREKIIELGRGLMAITGAEK